MPIMIIKDRLPHEYSYDSEKVDAILLILDVPRKGTRSYCCHRPW